MRQTVFFTLCLLAISAPLLLSHGQRIEARNTIPDTITGCYQNSTAYNRFTRQPMHIENLIAIIRKIETKTDGMWDARRISRVLVHRYMFDGMQFHRDAKPEFQYRQKPEERAKSLMIKELIRVSAEEQFPDGILDNDEKCALHWMLSHSMNATMRDDEEIGTTYPGSGSGYGSGNGYGYNSGNNGNNPGYGGSNPFNSNPPYNNNGSPNNGNNNPNPSLGNNYYNRGKREAVPESGNNDDNWDNSSESKEDSKEAPVEPQVNETVNAPLSRSASADLSDLPQDTEADFDVLPNANADSSSKSGKQIAQFDNRKRTRRPVETGVVYTKYGAVSAGRLISGIAAGLESAQMSMNGVVSGGPSYGGGSNPWSGGSGLANGNGNSWGSSNSGSGSGYGTPWKSMDGTPQNQQPQSQYPGQVQTGGQRWNGRKKRQAPNYQPLESLYAATLAGDAGQAAILNAVNQISNNGLPTGQFNDSVCPREYILYEHPDPNREIYKDSSAYTYLTEAEVRGGLDGIILGSNIKRWDQSAGSNLQLSSILEQYYSDSGIAGEPQFRSCDRSALLSQSVDGNKLKEQSRSFAYLYNNRTNEISDQKIIADPNAFENIVNEAYQRMYGTASAFNNLGPGCERRVPGGTDDDNQKLVVPKLTVYAVLDHSATYQEIDEQKRFIGQLAYELNVSPKGSRLGLVDGNSGNIIISPNWTDTSSILACRVMSVISQTKTQDYTRVLTNLKSELIRVRSEELRYNHTLNNGIVILFLVQGKRLEENQRNDIIRLTNEINNDREVGNDINVVASSSKYSESDFGEIRFVKIEASQNFSQAAPRFAESLMKRTHGSLRYLHCNDNQYNQDLEHTIATDLYINPGTIEYYKISPNYFFSSRALILRFSSFNGKVRVCMSRGEWYPNKNNEGSSGVQCKETNGNYIAPGRTEVDVEFRDGLKKPCSKYRAEGCDPIYISITPTEFSRPGEVGLDCSLEPCTASNQVKVTFTHWDMRCNGAIRTLFSTTFAILATSLALFNWLKTT